MKKLFKSLRIPDPQHWRLRTVFKRVKILSHSYCCSDAKTYSENSIQYEVFRIRSRIRLSEVRIHGSGSVPECHGSGTLTVIFLQTRAAFDICKKKTATVYMKNTKILYRMTASSTSTRYRLGGKVKRTLSRLSVDKFHLHLLLAFPYSVVKQISRSPF
jgi:hypothetical protein